MATIDEARMAVCGALEECDDGYPHDIFFSMDQDGIWATIDGMQINLDTGDTGGKENRFAKEIYKYLFGGKK